MSRTDDIGEKNDWRLVAVALAGVVRPLSREDELRRGWDAAAEKARRAEADAEAELRRAERAEADAAALRAEVDALAERLEAVEAARAQAPAVPVTDPTGEQAGENERLRSQINALYADLNALREKQLDTQKRCDKAIQARIEAQRERVAAEKARDEMAAMLADVHSQEGAVKALEYENKFLADRLLCAQKDRDAAIKERVLAINERDKATDERDTVAAQLAYSRAVITEQSDQIKQANAALAAKLGPAAGIDPVPGASAEPETSQSAADRAGRLELVTIGQIVRDGRGGLAQVCGVLHNANKPGHALSFGLGGAGPMRPVGVWAAEGWDVLP